MLLLAYFKMFKRISSKNRRKLKKAAATWLKSPICIFSGSPFFYLSISPNKSVLEQVYMSHNYLLNTKSWWEKQISKVQVVRLSDDRKILGTVKINTRSQEQHEKTWSLSSTQVHTWEDEGKVLLENENKQ